MGDEHQPERASVRFSEKTCNRELALNAICFEPMALATGRQNAKSPQKNPTLALTAQTTEREADGITLTRRCWI